MSEKPKVNDLRNIIERIKNINIKIFSKTLEEKEEYFFKNHSDIMDKYPFLVSQICSGGDLSTLDYMLSSLEQVEKGNSTNDIPNDQLWTRIKRQVTPCITVDHKKRGGYIGEESLFPSFLKSFLLG